MSDWTVDLKRRRAVHAVTGLVVLFRPKKNHRSQAPYGSVTIAAPGGKFVEAYPLDTDEWTEELMLEAGNAIHAALKSAR